jgi:hypothetical protein
MGTGTRIPQLALLGADNVSEAAASRPSQHAQWGIEIEAVVVVEKSGKLFLRSCNNIFLTARERLLERR